ncbi:MAG: DUF6273 domain-containing protein [Lachnospiraceae bacterium]|nr:DUF6273 domain-containing protein [Lachnospiraceae bacterium]
MYFIKYGINTNSFGGFSWRVIDVSSDKILLLSEDIIFKGAYNRVNESTVWQNCTLRKYLNNDFYNAFGDIEKARISETRPL